MLVQRAGGPRRRGRCGVGDRDATVARRSRDRAPIVAGAVADAAAATARRSRVEPPAPRAGRAVDPTSLDDYRALRRLRGARARDRARARRGDPAGHRREAPRPRRRRVPDGGEVAGGRRAVGAPALRDLQRRRVRARDLQGPRRDGARSRSRWSRRSRSPGSRPGAEQGFLYIRGRVPAGDASGSSTRSTRRGGTGSSATT